MQAPDRCDQCLSHNADGHRQPPVESGAEGFLSTSLWNPPAQNTGADQNLILLYTKISFQASSSNFGSLASGPLKGLDILGVVGDQQVFRALLTDCP